jgi:hypothetical protein
MYAGVKVDIMNATANSDIYTGDKVDIMYNRDIYTGDKVEIMKISNLIIFINRFGVTAFQQPIKLFVVNRDYTG